MPYDVEQKQFSVVQMGGLTGKCLDLYYKWRNKYGLFPETEGLHGCLHSLVDACLLISCAQLTNAGFGTRHVIPWAQKFLPQELKGVAYNRLNHGIWSGTSVLARNEHQPDKIETLDLDTIVEQAITGLDIQLPVFNQTPPLKLAMTIAERVNKYLDKPAFKTRVSKLKKPPQSLAELSVALGVPLWILTAQDEADKVWPVLQRVRSVYPAAKNLRIDPVVKYPAVIQRPDHVEPPALQ
jgi:hypothetical protein